MKIGINASFLRKQKTGIGQVTANFLKKLAECQMPNIKNQKLDFILYLEEDIDLKLQKNFQKRIFLPPYKRDDLIRRIWWEKFLLPKKAKEDQCDILLSLYQSATHINNAKHIMLVHDIIPKIFPQYLDNFRKKLYQFLVERAIRKADKIIAISHWTEKDLIKHLAIEAGKITVINVDVDEIYKKETNVNQAFSVLKKYGLMPGYIYNGGGLEIRKNNESILRAYKMLRDKYGQHGWLPKLVISGKLMPQLAPLVLDIEKLVKELELKKDVVLLDYIPQEDAPILYRNAAVFVYPSRYEGFGLPVLEAMNQGVPVITSKVSSLPEVGSDAVLYCDPDDYKDLAMVLKNLLNNNHLKAALSMKGKERATHFSWDKFVEKTINIIYSL
jgi:glycosyltransferase involved in cell wall biosynthesis